MTWGLPPKARLRLKSSCNSEIQKLSNASGNKVGRPTIQLFKGVAEEQNAHRGYVITTSTFTEDAIESAALTSKTVLVAIDDLVRWHVDPPIF